MKCRVCGREIEDDTLFCKYCGAEQKKKRKRLTWAERRRKNEAETAEFISKASLHAEDIADAAKEDEKSVRAVSVGKFDTYRKKQIAVLVAYAVLAIVALAGLVLLRYSEINATVTVVIAFALLLVAAYGAAGFAERLFAVRALEAMKKSGRAIKKVRYGKPPLMLCDGEVYRLDPTGRCPKCGAERHIEEFEGRQILVCNADRGHLAVLDSERVFADTAGEPMSENDEDTPADGAEEDKREGSYDTADTAAPAARDGGGDAEFSDKGEEETENPADGKEEEEQ